MKRISCGRKKSYLFTYILSLSSPFFPLGSDFLCITHIIPVKTEEGVVMMFILNFDYEGSSDSLERYPLTPPAKSEQREFSCSPIVFCCIFAHYTLLRSKL